MHLKFFPPLIAMAMLFCMSGCGAFAATPAITPETPPFPVAQVVAEVKRELLAVQNTPGASTGLKLSKVSLGFTLVRTKDATGKVTIGIPAIEAEVGGDGHLKSETTSSLTVELVPPAAGTTMSAIAPGNLGITEAILDVRKQLVAGLADEPKLDPSKVELTLKYVLTREGGPTGKIKFLIVSIEGGATISSGQTQSITLTFSKGAP